MLWRVEGERKVWVAMWRVEGETGQVWEVMWRVEGEGEVVQSPQALPTHQVYWPRVVWEVVQMSVQYDQQSYW